MKIFHIRQPRPKHWKTLCGAPTTSHDDRYSWQAVAVGDFAPCDQCVRLKREATAKKNASITMSPSATGSRL